MCQSVLTRQQDLMQNVTCRRIYKIILQWPPTESNMGEHKRFVYTLEIFSVLIPFPLGNPYAFLPCPQGFPLLYFPFHQCSLSLSYLMSSSFELSLSLFLLFLLSIFLLLLVSFQGLIWAQLPILQLQWLSYFDMR